MAKKVLIIEDEAPLAHALQMKLDHEGIESETALGGEEGVAMLEKDEYGLILLDLIMPKVDGFAVLNAIKEKKITTPVFVLTNLSQTEDEKKVKELGAEMFFVKSNTPLTTIVESVTQKLK
ncbi:MAG: response regulator [bacterium]|nr:response regulator [bacterium]